LTSSKYRCIVEESVGQAKDYLEENG